MKYTSAFVIFASIFMLFCSNVKANDQQRTIAINIETEEMQRIAEVLVESYLENNLRQNIPRRFVILAGLKKIAIGSVQYIGIMLSLVGANIITKMFESPYQPEIILSEKKTTATESEQCPHDFGCDHRVCWRSCGENETTTDSWCYTSPTPEKRQYKECEDSLDCSPCWDCISACQNKNN